MINRIDCQQFLDSTIGQSDDQDYSESGYIAIFFNGTAAIASYGHCSCYDTWDDISGGGSVKEFGEMRWTWTGSLEDLVKMATDKADPSIPSRVASPEDNDYGHLIKMYDQVLEWHRKRTEGK